MIRKRLSTLLVATCFGLGSFGFVAGFTPAGAQDDFELEVDDEQEWDWGEEETFFEEDVDQEGFVEGDAQDVSDVGASEEHDATWFGPNEYGYDQYGYYDENYEWESGRAAWFEEWYGESDDWF